MKVLIYIAAFLVCLSAKAQNLQIQGKFLNCKSDTIHIQVWSDGDQIVDRYTVDPFYALILGDRKHYTIKTTSGDIEKYCTLICYYMEFENIQVDIDFRSRQSVVIYKQRKSANKYTFLFYGSGSVQQKEIKIYETN